MYPWALRIPGKRQIGPGHFIALFKQYDLILFHLIKPNILIGKD
jgi:hypothetical protein